MNKRILMVLTVLAIIVAFVLMSRGAVLYKAADIPFAYDAASVQYELQGGIEGRAGTEFVWDQKCTDPDGDPFVIAIINPEPGMTITENTSTGRWDIKWTPTTPGTYTIDIEAIDIPPPGNQPLSARGTVVFNVLLGNRAPDLEPR